HRAVPLQRSKEIHRKGSAVPPSRHPGRLLNCATIPRRCDRTTLAQSRVIPHARFARRSISADAHPQHEEPDMATVLAPPSSSSHAAQAHQCLAPLLSSPDAPDAFYGRRYEDLGASDRLRAVADVATGDLEGLPLRAALDRDVDTVLAAITPQWIEDQVESAVLQSTPERVMAELATQGAAHDLIFTPPAAVAELRVPALTFRPLIEAVDADARRLAYDPAQEELRAQALPLDRMVALRIPEEI